MSNKSRKRNLRKITVNDELYNWLVFDYNCDGDGGSRFKIWKDKVLVHYDIVSAKVITPKTVRDIILKLD